MPLVAASMIILGSGPPMAEGGRVISGLLACRFLGIANTETDARRVSLGKVW